MYLLDMLLIYEFIHLDEASNEQTTTYYNLNNTDVIKAQKARQEVYYEFSPVYRPSKTAVPVSEFKYFVDCKKRNNEFFAEQFKVRSILENRERLNLLIFLIKRLYIR